MKISKLVVFTLVAGFSLSHAIVSLPIKKVTASSTLPNQGKNNYKPGNMLLTSGEEVYERVWAATFKGKPITLEFSVNAERVDAVAMLNGYVRDSASYVNNSLAKSMNIYLNSKDNLVKTVSLKRYNWEAYTLPDADLIAFDKPLENVKKIIVEINDIYPGKKWKDVCISLFRVLGYTKAPNKLKTGEMTDPRDGKTYRTVQVGKRTWMAQDLRYKSPKSRTAVFGENSSTPPADIGLEYPWDEAVKGLCPAGWHLPSRTEFGEIRSVIDEGDATLDDLSSVSGRPRSYMVIPEFGEFIFFPTDALGVNISTMTRLYYDGECAEEWGEFKALAPYWTSDAISVPLWGGESGTLKFYRFGGSDFCDAGQGEHDDPFHFVRCVKD